MCHCTSSLTLVEGYARFGLGLGDPPLTVRDPQIDYIFAPSRTYLRFGNRITYNAFSMRADEVDPTKSDSDELRVLLMGDSVINGGALNNDADLATRLVQTRLIRELGRPVWVGNISAGSWGPGNLLAYAHRYGWFDADIVLIVLSSHDIADVPDFTPDLGPDFPSETPWFAAQEIVSRYLPRYTEIYFEEARRRLPRWASWFQSASAAPGSQQQDTLAEGRRLLEDLLEEAKSHVPVVAVLQHMESDELVSGPNEYGRMLAADVRRSAVPLLQLGSYLEGTAAIAADTPYRDNIHLNARGQRLYAEAFDCVVRTLQAAHDLGSCQDPPTTP